MVSMLGFYTVFDFSYAAVSMEHKIMFSKN